MGTGIINSLTIGDSPIDPMDITIDDIRRVSQLRIILSDSYLGSMHTKSEVQRDADRLKKEAQLRAEAAALEQQNIEDDEMEGEGKDEDENKSTSEIDIPAKRLSNNMQADIETNDLPHPYLDDYPLVSQALEEMYSNLGKIENQNIKVQNKDAVYTGNIQEKESGSTFRILRPLMDVATTREEAGKAYERKIEEERRKKEEERRRKEEERRRKEEELRRKREAERQRKEDEKKRKKDEERQKKLELRYRQEEEQRRKKMDIQTRRKKEQEDIQARKGSGRNKNDKDNRKIWQGNDWNNDDTWNRNMSWKQENNGRQNNI